MPACVRAAWVRAFVRAWRRPCVRACVRACVRKNVGSAYLKRNCAPKETAPRPSNEGKCGNVKPASDSS
eukprot:6210668-Pleurochrysis_carterae.AAC.1